LSCAVTELRSDELRGDELRGDELRGDELPGDELPGDAALLVTERRSVCRAAAIHRVIALIVTG
jgi:hypothetical protein